MQKTRLWLAAAVLSAMTTAAVADIYKCTDAAGHVTYSNAATKGCSRLVSSAGSEAPAAPAGKAASKPAVASPAGFPRVDGQTQRARDDERRRILDGEFQNEQKSLEEAKKELAEAEAIPQPGERNATQRCVPLPNGGQSCSAVPSGINRAKVEERVQPLKDKVSLHERNLEALKKEIANLK